MEKIDIEVFNDSSILENENKYGPEDITEAINHYYPHIQYDYWRIEAFTEYGYYPGDNDYARLRVIGYRKETDDEFAARKLAKEQAEARANADRVQKAEKQRQEKEKQEALLVDPEYQKYLELQKKFKK